MLYFYLTSFQKMFSERLLIKLSIFIAEEAQAKFFKMR